MEPRPLQETDMESLDPHEDPRDAAAESADHVHTDDDGHGDHDDHPDASHDASHDAGEGEAGADETAYAGAGGRDVPTAPTTGDAVVDAAMIELAAAEAGSLAERIEAGERAHRVLQGRLSDLGGA